MYGVGPDVPGSHSLLSSRDLVREVRRPDPRTGEPADTLGQRDSLDYNALGERIRHRDGNGTVHELDRDSYGRLVADRVVEIDPQLVDDSVGSVTIAYTSLGQPARVTSHDSPDPKDGRVVDPLAHDTFLSGER